MTHIAACDRHDSHRQTPLTHDPSHDTEPSGNAIGKSVLPCSLFSALSSLLFRGFVSRSFVSCRWTPSLTLAANHVLVTDKDSRSSQYSPGGFLDSYEREVCQSRTIPGAFVQGDHQRIEPWVLGLVPPVDDSQGGDIAAAIAATGNSCRRVSAELDI